MRAPISRAGLAALAAAVALATRAAEAPPRPPYLLELRDGHLTARIDLGPVFSPDLKKQLSNGLTNVIALHVALLPEHGDAPVALYGREIDVLYDVWDETYGVTVKDPLNPRGRRRVFRAFEDLRAFLADGSGMDLGPVAPLENGIWVLQTRVELNPVSKELLERTREFIANPTANVRGGTPSRSVLGAMASYLLRRADPGAVVRILRSPPFTTREVATR